MTSERFPTLQTASGEDLVRLIHEVPPDALLPLLDNLSLDETLLVLLLQRKDLQGEFLAEVDSKAAASADAVYPRVFPVVAAAADTGNVLAQSLLNSAGAKLAGLAHRLAESLNLSQQKFPLGKTGGTVGRSRFFDQAIDRELRRKLPHAILSSLSVEPSEVAAWIALQLLRNRERAVP